MTPVYRWFVRLTALGVLAGVWLVLPYTMPGAPRVLRAIQLLCMSAAVGLSLLALLATVFKREMVKRTPGVRPGAAFSRADISRITGTAAEKGGSDARPQGS